MMRCPHCSHELPVPVPAGPGDLSTSTEAQEQRILTMLREGPKTSPQLLAAGCVQYTARIFGLRRRGHDIETTLYDGIGLDQQFHKGLALYRLISEPEAQPEREQQPEAQTEGAYSVATSSRAVTTLLKPVAEPQHPSLSIPGDSGTSGVSPSRERWRCLLCKSLQKGRHGTLDDKVTPCPNGAEGRIPLAGGWGELREGEHYTRNPAPDAAAAAVPSHRVTLRMASDGKLHPDGAAASGDERRAAVETLERMGYTYHGAQLWKPPLGPRPAWVDAARAPSGDPKAFSTLQARAALLGVSLDAIRNDAEDWTFIATIGPVTQELRTLGEVEQWLDQLPCMAR